MPRSLEEQREHEDLVRRVITLEYHTGLVERPAPIPIAPAAAAPADNPGLENLAGLAALLEALRAAGAKI